MSDNLRPEPVKRERRSIPLSAGLILALLVWAVFPWAISLPATRMGWSGGHPGLWNWLGIMPVALGLGGLYWGVLSHASSTSGQIDMEPAKDYLLTEGLYRFSRNPMYLSELILMTGWVIFYGSIPVLIVLIGWWAYFNFYQIPSEERILTATFGVAYAAYKKETSRWFGKRSQ